MDWIPACFHHFTRTRHNLPNDGGTNEPFLSSSFLTVSCLLPQPVSTAPPDGCVQPTPAPAAAAPLLDVGRTGLFLRALPLGLLVGLQQHLQPRRAAPRQVETRSRTRPSSIKCILLTASHVSQRCNEGFFNCQYADSYESNLPKGGNVLSSFSVCTLQTFFLRCCSLTGTSSITTATTGSTAATSCARGTTAGPATSSGAPSTAC